MRWIRESRQDFGLLIIRLIVGGVLIFHGSQKLFGLFDGTGLASFAAFLHQLKVPYPEYAAVVVAVIEFVGGFSLVTGLWLRTMAILLVGTMGTAIVLVHPNAFAAQDNGMEFPLTLASVLLGLCCTGAGRFVLSGAPKLRVPRIISASAKRVGKAAASATPIQFPESPSKHAPGHIVSTKTT